MAEGRRPGCGHEPALAAALGEWAPDHVLVPLAVHEERRLLLLPDGGQTLRAAVGAGSVEGWQAMLRDYAELQVELIPHAAQMVALGVPDARPDRLPELATELLADDEALLLDRPDGLTSERRARIVADLARYRESCRRLAEFGIPPTLQHDDLHDANVFVGAGRHRFFDWGDAVVSHPFVTLLVSLRVAQRALEVPNGTRSSSGCATPTSTPGATTAACRRSAEQADLALTVGPLQRALTWRRILRGVHRAERAEWQDSVPGWTAEYLEPGTLTAQPTVQAARLHAWPPTDDASGDLAVTGSVVVPASALSWRFSRSSGPGGQGVNTADSRVELSVAPLELPGLTEPQQQRLAARLGSRLVDGVLTIAASEHRQQLRNRQAARERLAAVLRAALAPPAAQPAPDEADPRLAGAPDRGEEAARPAEEAASLLGLAPDRCMIMQGRAYFC